MMYSGPGPAAVVVADGSSASVLHAANRPNAMRRPDTRPMRNPNIVLICHLSQPIPSRLASPFRSRSGYPHGTKSFRHISRGAPELLCAPAGQIRFTARPYSRRHRAQFRVADKLAHSHRSRVGSVLTKQPVARKHRGDKRSNRCILLQIKH
jgi:hypothetical protein